MNTPAKEAADYAPAHILWIPGKAHTEFETYALDDAHRSLRHGLRAEPWGVVVIRDDKPDAGPDNLPEDLRRQLCGICAYACVIVDVQPRELPEAEQWDRDESLSVHQANDLTRKHWVAFVVCTASVADTWASLFAYHNPDVWLSRIDGDGAKVVREGKKWPLQS